MKYRRSDWSHNPEFSVLPRSIEFPLARLAENILPQFDLP